MAVYIRCGGGGLKSTLEITFDNEAFKGLPYTVVGGDETINGIVPDSLKDTVHIHNLNTLYKVTCEVDGDAYEGEVTTTAYYGLYTAEVNFWRATLSVTVTDKGAGVAGAKVTAASADKTYGPVATDAEGKVTIKIGKAGTYTVTATNSAGEETNPKTVEVTTAGETYNVKLYFVSVVSWKEGTADEIIDMINHANDGEIDLSEFWTSGEEVNTQTVTDICANADYLTLVTKNDVALSVLCSDQGATDIIVDSIQTTDYVNNIKNAISNSSLFEKQADAVAHKKGGAGDTNKVFGANTNSIYIPYKYTWDAPGGNAWAKYTKSATGKHSSNLIMLGEQIYSGVYNITDKIAFRGTILDPIDVYVYAYCYVVK